MEVVKPVKRNVLLNPGPATTTDSVKYAQVVPDICPREEEFVQVMAELRRELVKVVHGDPNKYTCVPFAGSGTIIQDVCVNSLVPAGQKLLIVNNGAYGARMAEIADYYHIPCVNLKFSTTDLPDLAAVGKALDQDKDIAVVAAVHHETGTGVLNPIQEIGQLTRDHNCTFIVDTISTYGLIPVDLEKMNIDFCMSSAQKGMAAMTGLSWVVGRTDEIKKSKNYPTRSYYCNLYLQYDYFEKTGEMHFTPPVQNIYALRQAIKEHWEEGEQAKWERLTRCWKAVHQGLAEMGLEQVIRKEIQSRLVTTVKAPQDPRFSFQKLHDYCYERGFTIYPGKMFGLETFRLCNLGRITPEDIEAFFVVAREAFQEMGFSLPIKQG
ncbi:MAG: 2-aminoethylphosphonate aminotransferase [Thermodesulfobacteriota bacterium]